LLVDVGTSVAQAATPLGPVLTLLHAVAVKPLLLLATATVQVATGVGPTVVVTQVVAV
jgi:hypothetical protein